MLNLVVAQQPSDGLLGLAYAGLAAIGAALLYLVNRGPRA